MSFLNLDEWMALVRHVTHKSGFAAPYIQASRECPPEKGLHRWSFEEVRRGTFRLECHLVLLISDPDEFLPLDVDPGRDWLRNRKLWLDLHSGQAEHEVNALEERQVRYRIQAPYPKVALTTCLSEDEIRQHLGAELAVYERERV